MKKVNFLLILLSLQLLSCNTSQYPEFRKMENISFQSLNFNKGLSATLKGDAVFFNPNMLGATVTGMDFDVFVNDKKVTKVNQKVSAEMAGNSEFKLPLEFKVPLTEVFKDIQSNLGNLFKKKKIEYKLIGYIKISLGGMEVSVPVEYQGEEKVRI